MALKIPMEDYASQIRRRNNERLEILKAKEFPKLQSTNTMLQGTEDYDTNILMDVALYEAVAKDDVNNFINTLEQVSMDEELNLDSILNQMTISGNSLLHKAASFGSVDIAELIIDHFPFLLYGRNNLGDTALHVATKAKKLSIVKVLIDKSGKPCPPNDNDTLSQMKNHIGNSALHEAVIARFPDAISVLFLANPKVAYYLNEKGESPLRLAIETGDTEIFELLFKAPGVYDEFVGGPQEESPVYTAILMKRIDILKDIFKKNPILFYIRDKKRKTPLHFAASKGYTAGVRYLLSKFGLQALQRSTNGDFPIHIACKKGHIKVVEELLKQKWPNPTDLINKEGQSILHVAAESGMILVVKIILENLELEELLNAEDNNGNTALHLASMNLHALILCSLTWDKRIDLNRRNKKGLTAIDIALGTCPCSSLRQGTSRLECQGGSIKLTTVWALGSAGTPVSEKGKKTFLLNQKKLPNMEIIKGRVDFILVIAVLVATVTFAAGLTVPGGFNSSDNGPTSQGLATLGNTWAFQVFIVSDSMAMYFSMTGAFLLICSLAARDVAKFANFWALILVEAAIFAMSVAFMSATYLVVVIPLMLYYTQPFNDKVDDQKQESFSVEKDKHEESQPSNKDRQEEFQQKKD
ncbi:protein ACCELERATED CELL DEATH 6 isoform X3 [Quercus suber]|uniref:protein ACCELERATED CELL DEATH 6 isoform X3 n=1 Tax=Quercus suber TaxID=58331 RepID=UPI000CE25ECF|nr:protein ACCELERATED CELL DEATH 6-like isoform X3 [Quercus suber]